MTDNYGRTIEYLRLSVTDLCNLRCLYCMNEDGVAKRAHSDILSIEELTEIARAAHELGISKIRLTGGEPLIRRGIVTLCRNIKSIDPAIELSVTTNGVLLSDMAAGLRSAGVDRLNISLDTLDPAKYKHITRIGELSDVTRGIDAAESAGFKNTKINTVLLGGFNNDEIADFIELTRERELCVRFIELMPIGEAANWEAKRFLSCSAVEAYLGSAELVKTDGVARVYRLPDHKGSVGLISPMSRRFCDRCNKIRVTADGKLKPCLHSDDEIDLRGLSGIELRNAIREGIMRKPPAHDLGCSGSATARYMNEIGG